MKKCNTIETNKRKMNMPHCAIWLDDGDYTSSGLVYDGDQDGTPDNITTNGDVITITPTDLSVGECDNDVVYALQNDITGVSINSTNAVISIDCGIASQESCDLMILIDTLCDGTVIGTRSMNIVLTCGGCDEDEGTQLDYDGDDDGIPDNITSNNTTVIVTPIELQTVGCENGVITYVLNPEETPEGATIDENTAVISIDCQLIATANADCSVTLDVYPRCDGEYIVINGVEQHTIINVPLRDYCISECGTQETQLDYDGNNDGVPDTVTVSEDIVTVTPIEVSSGECPSDVTYEFAEDYGEGFVLNSTTGVVTIDCTKIEENDCGKEIVVNTMCQGNLVTHATFNAPTTACASCSQTTELDYDGNDDGVPDTVTIDGDIITITPVDLDTGHCVAPNHIVYSLPTRGTPDGVTIDPTTGVITIDCSLIGTNVCELNLTVNTECVEQ